MRSLSNRVANVVATVTTFHKSTRFRRAAANLRVRDKRSKMTYSEFRRWLLRQGATITARKGSHFTVTLGKQSTIFPFHGSKEIGTGLVEKIKRDLGLKGTD
jgi:mRNA interferase HicA